MVKNLDKRQLKLFLRDHLLYKKVRMYQLADHTGVCEASISNYLNLKRENSIPRYDQFVRMMNGLGYDVIIKEKNEE